uniref:Kinesin motor domain-containing protein n=1 Tax=Daucus carota subsp. sativus TaxID=79200 RepID=A0A162AE08_DAUCS
MENSETKDCVRVAVNIRPLVTAELAVGCTDCITVPPGEPQVQIGAHAFTFDYVFGSSGQHSSRIYEQCVAPLVDALCNGYNGTVLAYGQTGSGKTYTMGTNYNGEGHNGGVIPNVIETIFSRVEEAKDSTEFLIRVSFIEIFKEEVYDLLDPNPVTFSKVDGTSQAKPGGPARAPIQIRETANGGITLAGVTEAEVRTKEEMASFLLRGSLCRATGSTNMNSQSSRSHAIFTISMEQKRISLANGDMHDANDDILCAKLHLVDLAGSERAKRTGADGLRLREGIHINKGLLALGNVISALGDEKKRKEGGHVPYRDSKLTRLLQATCVSPADTNAEETLNTLKYANRARNIQNKAIVNRDPVAAQTQRMRNQIEQLQAELLYFRGDSGIPFEELQILKHKISLLEASNAELQRELQECRINSKHLSQRAIDAQVEKDNLIMKLELARSGRSWEEIDADPNQRDIGLVKNYVTKIQELEGELFRLQKSNTSKHHELADYLKLDVVGYAPKKSLFDQSDTEATDTDGEAEVDVKELEHSSIQEKLDMELKELDKKLEQKEAEMKRFAGVDTSVLKQHYEKKVLDLEQEKKTLQKEIEQLRCNLANISSSTDGSTQKLKENYLQKLNFLESQVLQRKSEEAAMATKRLKEVLDSRKASSRMPYGDATSNGPSIQALMHAIEHEIEVTKRVHEVRCEYERQMEERTKMAKEMAELKEETQLIKRSILSDCPSAMSPGARNSRIFALENMLSTTSSTLVSMASQLSEAEERERAFTGRGRWNQVRSLAEAKTIMNFLFNLASSTRCSLWDKEVSCREKDLEIRELKEKVVHLVRQLEMQKAEIIHQEKLLKTSIKNSVKEKDSNSGDFIQNQKSRVYDLRLKASQNSTICEAGGYIAELLEDMDTSESEHSDREHDDDRDWEVSGPDEGEDSGWGFAKVKGNRRQTNQKVSKSGTHLVSLSTSSSVVEPGSVNMVSVVAENPILQQKAFDLCCSCSKNSFCKTGKCECRAAGGSCCLSCGCHPKKCSNREENMIKELGALAKLEQGAGTGSVSNSDTIDSSCSLASHGAMLLQTALAEISVNTKNDAAAKRKPLSDIGNAMRLELLQPKSDAPKPDKRKKWRKPTYKIVQDAPPSQPEISEVPTSTAVEPDIPLILPRAMRSMSSSTTLKERNSDQQPKGLVATKEADSPAPRSPRLQARPADDKENGL